MLNRMIGAARLSVETYEEVEHDRSATIQALVVVVVVAIFSGVGSVLSGDVDLLDGVILGAVRGVVAWAVWALFTWIIGSTILIPIHFERTVKPSFPRRRESTPWPYIYGGITVTWYK